MQRCLGFSLVGLLAAGSLPPLLGIDLGNEYFKVSAIAPGHNLEIILNSQSLRKTPSVVNFDNLAREFGEKAIAQQSKKPQTTIQYFVDQIPLNIDDLPFLPVEFYPYNITEKEDPRRSARISLNNDQPYANHSLWHPLSLRPFYTEEIVAHLLSHIRDMVRGHLKHSKIDEFFELEIALVVPVGYTYRQRQALKQASYIAGLKSLAFVEEPFAAAVSHSLDLHPDDHPAVKIFFSLGSTNMQACAVEFTRVPVPLSLRGGFGTQSNSNEMTKINFIGCHGIPIGGHQIDLSIAKLAMDKTSLKSDNPRMLRKLVKDSNKLKHRLSANKDAVLFIEDFNPDGVHLKTTINRDDIDKILAEERWEASIQEIRDSIFQYVGNFSELASQDDSKAYNISSVELLGGSWRIPRVYNYLETIFKGIPLGQRCNADEAMAVGAAMMAANNSMTYKFKPLMVAIPSAETLKIEIRTSSTSTDTFEFPKGTILGHTITKEYVVSSAIIEITVRNDNNKILDKWTVGGLDSIVKIRTTAATLSEAKYKLYQELVKNDTTPTPLWNEDENSTLWADKTTSLVKRAEEPITIKIEIGVNHMGLVYVAKAVAVWTDVVVSEKKVRIVTPTAEVTPSTSTTTKEQSETPSTDSETSSTAAEVIRRIVFSAQPSPATRVLIAKTVDQSNSNGDLDRAEILSIQLPYPMTSAQLREARNRLQAMIRSDRETERLNEARNQFETVIYDLRSRVQSSFKIESSVQKDLLGLLSAEEDWLYATGFNSNRTVLTKKHKLLESSVNEAMNKPIKEEGIAFIKENTGKLNATELRRFETWLNSTSVLANDDLIKRIEMLKTSTNTTTELPLIESTANSSTKTPNSEL